jgi:hypothetical protein
MDVMPDQIIDRATAEGLQADARRDRLLVGWVVVRDQPGPGQFTARLVTEAPTVYVLRADTLAELHAQLPPGVERSDRQGSPARFCGDLVREVGGRPPGQPLPLQVKEACVVHWRRVLHKKAQHLACGIGPAWV